MASGQQAAAHIPCYGPCRQLLDRFGILRDYPDKASYKQHAYSLSVEYGKRFDFEAGFFVESQAQFTLGRLAGIDYTTDRGVNGRIDGMNSAIGRIGFVMGQKIENGSDIYLKADLLHEFAGERDLQLTSDAGGTNDILTKHNDYGDTWFELGAGRQRQDQQDGQLLWRSDARLRRRHQQKVERQRRAKVHVLSERRFAASSKINPNKY
mgnify:CR=1 FL=1